MIVLLSARVIVYVYLVPALRFFVFKLKIHCWAVGSHRNAVSGVVESGVSFGVTFGAALVPVSRNDLTVPAAPIETPLVSQTRNFAGTVLFCLNTLVPSALIGWRITWPASPLQVPAAAY